MRYSLRVSPLLALLLLSAACGDSPTEAASPIGTFAATRFTIVDNTGTHDLLPEGARLDLTLAAGGSVSGSLVIPDPGSSSGVATASMAGTWTLQGNILSFDQSADTFVRDTPFILKSSNRIEADQVFSGTRVMLTLTRQ
jgi:hypothetical protein